MSCGQYIEVKIVSSCLGAMNFVEEESIRTPEAFWGMLIEDEPVGMTSCELVDQVKKRLGDKLIWRIVIGNSFTENQKKELEKRQAVIVQKPLERSALISYLQTYLKKLK